MSEIWHSFIYGDKSPDQLNPVIHRSWQRCMDFNLDFKQVSDNEILPASQLRELSERQDDLLQAGKSVLPFLVRYLKGKKYIVLLCNRDGYILKALGHPPFLSKAQSVQLSPGANWREDVKGTNAIGTAMKEKQPVQVLGWEHYIRENHFLNCWASPIKNAAGELVGVLDISGEVGTPEDRLTEIVLMGAKMIEQNLQVLDLQNNFRLCREGIKMAAGMLREGFITINNRGEISDINEAGVALLGCRRDELLGRSANEVFQIKRSVLVNRQKCQIPLERPGMTLHSKFSQVKDENGNFLGAVGFMQLTPEKKEETYWLGRSALTRRVFRQAAKAASTLSTVLIQGDSGTGKEVVARYIHQLSNHSNGPFIPLNCAAIPATLIESELFGYTEGAFTGAKRSGQPGKFELASNGTIFFDEIGDMPLNVQASLLRVLQEREIYRIGDTKTRKVNARVIAATNKDLEELVEQEKFRLDLYYRLKVVSLKIPPLKERSEDILDLAPYFVITACNTQGRRPLAISDEVYSALLSYSWPGNIRELENCLESMIVMADGPVLTEADLPDEIRNGSSHRDADSSTLMEQQTKQAIKEALSKTNGKVAPAARLLGIGRTTLYRKLEEFNIKV